jgi:phytoene dehydrogenase-like protein
MADDLRDRLARARYDAIVVGSGPNGLCAAIALASAGCTVAVVEGAPTVGGGMRSAELTRPGFLHDICSAIHPMGLGSPFLRTLPLASRGLEWIHPPAPLAHPLDDGTAVVLERSVAATAEGLGEDGPAYRRVMQPLAEGWDALAPDLLAPLHLPRHPLLMARFGLRGLWPARTLARFLFRGQRARALFAGLAAHSILPLERPPSAAFGLVLGALAHAVGWPLPRGGSQRIAEALAAHLRGLGGEIVTGAWVRSVDELPPASAVLLDTTPRQLLALAGARLSPRDRSRLGAYRYGPGVFKLDLALSGPVPWRAEACARAATVHLGGTLEEIAASERAAWLGQHAERPYVLVAQQSLFDPSRAPAGAHTLWAYCHVPHGSTVDMSERILAQVERFAPGFRERVLARHAFGPADLEAYNPNDVGGDINGGAQDLGQLFSRPVLRLSPYTTSDPRLFLCSASTPPGGGVHGMCGYHAAQTALRRLGR